VSEITYDIGEMLDGLGLTTAAIRWNQIQNNPELGNFTAQQLFREVLTTQYIEFKNNQYETNLKFSRLIDKSARIENLKSGNGRKYTDAVVQQVLTFHFASSGLNVGVYGKTGAGKSYLMSALCNEACRRNYRCMLLDYCDLLDELLVLSRTDLTKYSKKLKYYSRIRLLFIDDFCISRYSEDGIKILYHLLKTRTDLHHSTVFTSQYEPSEWGKKLSDDPECYGKLDGIRRRLTTGNTIEIVKV
jgi:DNA replication protein DnaC